VELGEPVPGTPPRLLRPCERCGALSGPALWAAHGGQPYVVDVACQCANVTACGRCGGHLTTLPMNAFAWDAAADRVVYTSAVDALQHRCREG
jgi:hypothetical protein